MKQDEFDRGMMVADQGFGMPGGVDRLDDFVAGLSRMGGYVALLATLLALVWLWNNL